MICEYLKASGTSHDDCVILGRRTAAKKPKLRDYWLLVNEPDDDDCTNTHTRWAMNTPAIGIWRAPSKKVFLAKAEGVLRFDDLMAESPEPHVDSLAGQPLLAGIWGLSDDFVIAWGTSQNMYKSKGTYRFDGESWGPLGENYAQSELTAQPTAIHGTSRELLYAVGPKGFVARWDGSAWTKVAVPTKRDLLDVHVESEDEVYAVGKGGTFLRGGSGAWHLGDAGSLADATLHAVGMYKGHLYVGAGERGLYTGAEAGGLVEHKPGLKATAIESDGKILVCTPTLTAGTETHKLFQTAAEDMLFEITEGEPVGSANRLA